MSIQDSSLALPKKTQIKVVEELIENSRLTYDFYIMLVLSTVVVTLGLILNNTPVIIGGMLITPLLTPILTLALGVVIADPKLIWRSLRIIAKSLIIIVAISFIIAILFPIDNFSQEIKNRLAGTLPYFLIAFTAGLAATFAWTRRNLSAMLPGVAIAVSILPPLCMIGIAIPNLSLEIARVSLVNFLFNLFGIVLGSVIVFSLFNFYKAKKETVKAVTKEIKLHEKKREDRRTVKPEVKKAIKAEVKRELEREVNKEAEKERVKEVEEIGKEVERKNQDEVKNKIQ